MSEDPLKQYQERACQSTPAGELERQIMDSNVPKNEREWWATREIERLREALGAAADELLASHGQVANPGDPKGWDDPDVYRVWFRAQELLPIPE